MRGAPASRNVGAAPYDSMDTNSEEQRMSRIEGKKVLITGASSGIGEACARRFVREGADVVLWARRRERLQQLADELRDTGRNVDIASVDVRDRAAVDAGIERLAATNGVPHVLVNNAGLAAGFDPLQTGSHDDWDRMLDTNVKALLRVTGMTRRTGHFRRLSAARVRYHELVVPSLDRRCGRNPVPVRGQPVRAGQRRDRSAHQCAYPHCEG